MTFFYVTCFSFSIFFFFSLQKVALFEYGIRRITFLIAQKVIKQESTHTAFFISHAFVFYMCVLFKYKLKRVSSLLFLILIL